MKTSAPRSFRQIDNLVYELYELTPAEITIVEDEPAALEWINAQSLS